MKNLENYGVLELKNQELMETDGGILPIVVAAVVIDALFFGFVAGYVINS